MKKLPELFYELLKTTPEEAAAGTPDAGLSDKLLPAVPKMFMPHVNAVVDALVVGSPGFEWATEKAKDAVRDMILAGILNSNVEQLWRIHEMSKAVTAFNSRRPAGWSDRLDDDSGDNPEFDDDL